MSAAVTIYRTRVCPYCVMAARLLQGKGIAYDEIYLDGKFEQRRELETRTKLCTVPHVFVGEHLIGGYTELASAERSGELKRLLEGT